MNVIGSWSGQLPVTFRSRPEGLTPEVAVTCTRGLTFQGCVVPSGLRSRSDSREA